MFDTKAWRKKLSALLREHPDLTEETTGQVEINLNRGSITRMYLSTSEGGEVKITTKRELK